MVVTRGTAAQCYWSNKCISQFNVGIETFYTPGQRENDSWCGGERCRFILVWFWETEASFSIGLTTSADVHEVSNGPRSGKELGLPKSNVIIWRYKKKIFM